MPANDHSPSTRKALIIVDVQNDFIEGGSLPVTGGTKVAECITHYIKEKYRDYSTIIASKDFHRSNDDNGGHFTDWPVHCVSNTRGSRFAQLLVLPLGTPIVYKGDGVPAYSAFEGKTHDGKTLRELLDRVTRVDICGLAFDFCVQATALDAVKNYFDTTVLKYLTASVRPEDDPRVTEILTSYGVKIDT